MMTSRSDADNGAAADHGSISFEPLDGTQWRVTDHRLPANDARCLVGFVELRGGRYEAMRLQGACDRATFPSLQAARVFFQDPCPPA